VISIPAAARISWLVKRGAASQYEDDYRKLKVAPSSHISNHGATHQGAQELAVTVRSNEREPEITSTQGHWLDLFDRPWMADRALEVRMEARSVEVDFTHVGAPGQP